MAKWQSRSELEFLVAGIPYFQRTAVNPDRSGAQIAVAVYYDSATVDVGATAVRVGPGDNECARAILGKRAPLPLMTPLKVELVPLSDRKMASPVRVTAVFRVIPLPAASDSRVPRSKLSGPDPSLAAFSTAKVPPLMLVPPA
jgi:hypothetical protein